jgi:hypothetical protein
MVKFDIFYAYKFFSQTMNDMFSHDFLKNEFCMNFLVLINPDEMRGK